jgi:hypothetical protein
VSGFAIAILISITSSSSALAGAPSHHETGKVFASAESAAQALAEVAKTKNREQLRAILGPGSEHLQMSDQAQAEAEMSAFAAAFDSGHRLVRQSDARAMLEVGTNNWPFPIPIVQQHGSWTFDTEAGQEEIINRRIGRNELSAIETVRAYVDAQREYARSDRDGDGVLEYAQSILSTAGKKDGLYWSPELDGELSPLGPLVAVAQGEGYLRGNREKSGPQPFHGYCFRILTRQGKHAPGGKYNYVINGNMIGGFGLVAWPADYGNSGVMTFIINQQGQVYQKDLGRQTVSIAGKMDSYDPDPTWKIPPD